jgi:CRISPR-associated protein Cas2
MALTYVIAYDISDDHRRARVAAILQSYGDRIQRSVFLATIDNGTLNEARQRIAEIISPGTDSVYVFRQCAACWDAVGIHGQATVTDEPLCWTVF